MSFKTNSSNMVEIGVLSPLSLKSQVSIHTQGNYSMLGKVKSQYIISFRAICCVSMISLQLLSKLLKPKTNVVLAFDTCVVFGRGAMQRRIS